jgi:hypothetical protein
MKKKKKIPTSPPDIGGIPPTFTATTFASVSDKDNMSYNNNKRKAMIQERRKSIRSKRDKA